MNRVLYITSKPIYPKVDGGCVAMASFLSTLLKCDYKVSHITVSTEKHPFNLEEYPKEIANQIDISNCFIQTKVNAFDAAKSLIRKKSYNVERFYSNELKVLTESKINDTDFIILDSLYVSKLLPLIREKFKGQVFIRIHNIESEIWKVLAQNESNPIKKVYLKKLATDLKKYEHEIFKNIDGILTLSYEDYNYIVKKNLNSKIINIPVGIESKTPCSNYSSNELFHVGAMDWQPNIEAVNRLISIFKQNNLKKISKLKIVGKNSESFLKSPEEGIETFGFVNDLHEFSCNAGIMCSPINTGSGVRIKILEMMSMGIPIITTSIGAKGLHPEAKNAIIIADTDEEILGEYLKLKDEEGQRNSLGIKSIEFIKKYHNPSIISKELSEFIQSK